MRAPNRIALLASAAVAIGLAAGCGEDEDCCALPPEEIAYEVRGGYPRSSVQLEIGEDGRAVLRRDDERPLSFAVEDGRLDRLRAALERVHFDEIPPPRTDVGVCSDCPTIELRFGDEKYEARAKPIPEELIPAIEQLDRIAASAPDDPE